MLGSGCRVRPVENRLEPQPSIEGHRSDVGAKDPEDGLGRMPAPPPVLQRLDQPGPDGPMTCLRRHPHAEEQQRGWSASPTLDQTHRGQAIEGDEPGSMVAIRGCSGKLGPFGVGQRCCFLQRLTEGIRSIDQAPQPKLSEDVTLACLDPSDDGSPSARRCTGDRSWVGGHSAALGGIRPAERQPRRVAPCRPHRRCP
jgi:hypothetical protein